MTTVIILSSSPPPTFARSPTPVDSSSPLPSAAVLLQGQSPNPRRFKVKAGQRDGFSAGFCTARQVLAEKSGAENAILSSPGKNRFRSSQDASAEEICDAEKTKKEIYPTGAGQRKVTKPFQDIPATSKTLQDTGKTRTAESVGQNEDSLLKQRDEPLLLQRAVSRRLDWTPPKAQIQRQDDEKPVEYSVGYLNGMLNSFAYPDDKTSKAQEIQAHHPAKRRRIEPAKSISSDKVPTSITRLVKTSSAPVKVTAKRNRSPNKKALTITALATSNYVDPEIPEETPLMQYLTSTQAQLQDTSGDVGLETKVQKTKAAVSRLKGSKKKQATSLLLSPTSAMKTYDSQETIFGSASQLAREESPTFLRETIEAMKESESFMMSDPFSSPQRTQNLSLENTPKVGTARYRRTRSLWTAAGRDEDNALLHVDTVDLSDTPAVRTAFAGKDVMLQPNIEQTTSFGKPHLSLRGGYSPLRPNKVNPIIDINDISTPAISLTRSYSTTSRNSSPRKSLVPINQTSEENVSAEEGNASRVKEQPPPPPPKPNYAGFTNHELNKLIKSYGFKAMRKREKMIELLDRCWEEKHGQSEEVEAAQPEVAPFGDFLSKVHDLSTRPEPKVAKPRVRKKKADTDAEPKDKPVKKPRARKKKDSTNEDGIDTPAKPKVPRKRKPKASVNSGTVIDVDGPLITVPEELKALEAFDEWARPERKPKPKTPKNPSNRDIEPIQRPPTPPSTIPIAKPASPSAAAVESIPTTSDTNITATNLISTPAPTPSPPTISNQITAAIMHQSNTPQPGRNHNTDPTWHEKILLYDPIVLEDLAAWLNTEGLGAIGEDRELSALDVREWCETRGVCCLWKGGWRGNKLAQ